MSYLEHFKLKEQPFRLTPDPDFVYWSKQHARAKAYMESTIWLADGFVVITGEIGSGKTTLLHSFLNELEDDVVYAVISQTQLTPTEFLQAVLTEFGFKPFDKEKVELLDMLNMFFIEQYSNGKKVVMIIDEAQNLSKKVLEEVRMLSGIETSKEKVLRIILAGQPELKDKLEAKSLEQLMQRVRLRFHIGPLDKRELREYVEHRLAVAGRDDNTLFTADVYETLHRYTGGVPRLINTLCDTALLCVFADERVVVEESDIRTAGHPRCRDLEAVKVGDKPKSALDWIVWGREQQKKKKKTAAPAVKAQVPIAKTPPPLPPPPPPPPPRCPRSGVVAPAASAPAAAPAPAESVCPPPPPPPPSPPPPPCCQSTHQISSGF